MKFKYLLILTVFVSLSCEDLLVKVPQDELSPESFFTTEEECQLYTNNFYLMFPGGSSIYAETADIIVQTTLDDEVSGNRTVPSTSSDWDWDDLRDINFFLEYSDQCEDESVRNEYVGLARFFRAYFYYEKVKRYGDVPWVDKTLDADSEELYKGRDDRKVVMANVLEDIDYAIEYLSSTKQVYRVTKWTALALKSRIFLFEGTFRKYHELGDWEECLEEAAEAAEEFISKSGYSLYTTGTTPYLDLFASLSAIDTEIILARAYGTSMGLTHSANNQYTSSSYGQPGILQDVVDMYLMLDGSRFTDIEGYDSMSLVDASENRDKRMAQTMRTPGYTRVSSTTLVAPDMSATTTGYQIVKYVTAATYDSYNVSVNDLPLFRTAEVYLNFAEAKAELGTLTQSDLDKSVNLLRDRAGVADLNLDAANADPDPFLTSSVTGYRNVSGDNTGVILEIRRERTLELICEGFRYWDIMRWKEGKRFERTFYGMYFDGVGEYDLDGSGEVDFVIYDDSSSAGSETGVVYKTLSAMNLEYTNYGNIVLHDDIVRTWDEDRDYLYPIPTEDIILTSGAITQNPGWEDGLNY